MPKKRTDKEFKELVYNLVHDEYSVLGSYTNNVTPIKIQHNICGRVYMVKPKNFLAGSRCFSCQVKKNGLKKRKSPEEFEREFHQLSNNEYDLLTPYITKDKQIKVRHKVCGYVYNVYPLNFLSGNRCRKCYFKRQSSDRSHDTIWFKNRVKDLCGDEYEVLGVYHNNYTKIKMYHQRCQKSYNVLPSNFLEGTRCPYCRLSKGEQIIIKILENKNIDYKKEKTFKGCKNPKTNKALPFDFYLPKYNLCIEYDGIQHNMEVNFWGGKQGLEERKYRDSVKDQFCKNYHIDLLRIPYVFKTEESISKIIFNYISSQDHVRG